MKLSVISFTVSLVVATEIKLQGQLSKVFIPEILIKAGVSYPTIFYLIPFN